jgi:ABC-type multidrug transport system fused ATPase/permease subunit
MKVKILGFVTHINKTLITSMRMLKLVISVDIRTFSAIAISTLIPAIIPFIDIYIYKLIIDFVINALSSTQIDYSILYWLIGARVGTYFIQNISYKAQEYFENQFWTKMPIYMNQLIFSKISSLDMQYFENSEFKNLLEKVRDSYNHRPQNLVSNILYSVQSIVRVVISLVAIATLNPLMIFIITPVAVAEFINQTRFKKYAWNIWGWNTEHRKQYWYLTDLLQNPLTIKEVKIFSLSKKFLQDIKGVNEKFFTENSKLAKKSLKSNSIFDFFSTIVFVGFELYVVFLALSRRITVGDISFYTGVVSNFQNGLSGLFRNINGVYDHGLYVQSIFELLDTNPIIVEDAHAKRFSVITAPVIEFKNVSFSYPGSKKKILNSFNLIIESGEKVAFVGENGAGKSTIIKLLTRFYDVDKGEILLNGVNIKNILFRDLYKTLGVLFQDYNKYHYSIKDNIIFGDIEKSPDKDVLEDAAKSAGAKNIIENLPNKWDQMLGNTFERGEELSGGQWQKVALSRAFFRNAPILVLDEPTAAIDAKSESEIFSRVENLAKDKTVIIISHRFSTVRNADKIYVLENGKIKEAGNHDELLKLEGQYATLFKIQAKGYK